MIYGSVCSGIEAATVAWEPLGWAPAFFSEIEAFPRAVLAHHYPDVPCHGDFTTIEPGQYAAIDLLVGGTPCQDFSVAGLRAGIAGDRGRLTVEYCNLAGRLRPRWLVWENVPGVLSADDGNAFGIFLGALAELGYGTAYRVLDAQYAGVPQRRRRVFVIGYFGDWRPPAAVLFESASLSWNTPPSREARQVAPTISASGAGTERTGNSRSEADGLIAMTLNAKGGTGRNNPDETFIAFTTQQEPKWSDDGSAFTVTADSPTGGGQRQCVAPSLTAFNMDSRSPQSEEQQRIIGAIHAASSSVRRLTPRECERLQGFPDDYTLVPYRNKAAADGPRYRALGNSMAVPCMRWIGERIAMVEQLIQESESAA